MKHIPFKFFFIASALCLALASCKNHDEFDFAGTIVGYEICQSEIGDFGYLVSLDSPSDLGDSIMIVEDSTRHGHVIAIYQSPRQLKVGRHISGTIYLDSKFSKAHCYRTYTYRDLASDKDISLQEAIFVKVVTD